MKGGQKWNVGDGEVDDIQIEVFDEIVLEDGTTEERPRQYEKLYGWKDEWKTYEFYKRNPNQKPDDANQLESWNKFREFVDDWNSLVAKRRVPIWYKFNPEDEDGEFGLMSDSHNSLKSVDEWSTMYEFLKKQKWNERDAEQTKDNKNKYTEKSQFVVDCTQLLGIGGEAVVIRKDVKEKVKKGEDQSDEDQSNAREYEALKIIPIMKHNFESEKIDEMRNRVEARHDKADPEFNKEFMERQKQRQNRKG